MDVVCMYGHNYTYDQIMKFAILYLPEVDDDDDDCDDGVVKSIFVEMLPFSPPCVFMMYGLPHVTR